MTKLLSAAVAASLALAALTACNTVEGMGKDIKSAGKTVEKTANNAK